MPAPAWRERFLVSGNRKKLKKVLASKKLEGSGVDFHYISNTKIEGDCVEFLVKKVGLLQSHAVFVLLQRHYFALVITNTLIPSINVRTVIIFFSFRASGTSIKEAYICV